MRSARPRLPTFGYGFLVVAWSAKQLALADLDRECVQRHTPAPRRDGERFGFPFDVVDLQAVDRSAPGARPSKLHDDLLAALAVATTLVVEHVRRTFFSIH